MADLLDKTTWEAPALAKPLAFKLYVAKNLPMALLAGLQPELLEYSKASVSLPFNYLTKNPFQSIYFACQCMASELSTGILCMSHVLNSNRKISFLVVNMEADFSQKARCKTVFSCNDGAQIADSINRTITTGEPQTVSVSSLGKDVDGETVARFQYTWSFKTRE